MFAIEVEAGDLIRVPRGTHHWFDLCGDRRIRAIRLFQDASGWTPHYTQSGVDRGFQPVCFGPAYFPPADARVTFRLTRSRRPRRSCSTSRARRRRSRSCTTCCFRSRARSLSAYLESSRGATTTLRDVLATLRAEWHADAAAQPEPAGLARRHPRRRRRPTSSG